MSAYFSLGTYVNGNCLHRNSQLVGGVGRRFRNHRAYIAPNVLLGTQCSYSGCRVLTRLNREVLFDVHRSLLILSVADAFAIFVEIVSKAIVEANALLGVGLAFDQGP